mgnify:CR=1 FL=1
MHGTHSDNRHERAFLGGIATLYERRLVAQQCACFAELNRHFGLAVMREQYKIHDEFL